LAENHKFFPPLSFSAFAWGDPCGIYGKAIQIQKLVFQAANGEDLVIQSHTRSLLSMTIKSQC